jgi:hypothetical protein
MGAMEAPDPSQKPINGIYLKGDSPEERAEAEQAAQQTALESQFDEMRVRERAGVVGSWIQTLLGGAGVRRKTPAPRASDYLLGEEQESRLGALS